MVEGLQEEVEEEDDEDGSPGDARLERVHNDHDHHLSAAPKGMPPNVPKSERPDNTFYRVDNGSKIPDFGGKSMNGSAQSMHFRLAHATKALASVNKICQRKNSVVVDKEVKKVATSRTKHRDGRCPCV